MDDRENKSGPDTQNEYDASSAKKAETGIVATGVPPAIFLSSYAHSLDSKSRMVIPSVYREGLGRMFVIAPSLDFECIAIYPKEVWEYEINKLYRKAQKSVSVGSKALEHFSTYSYPNNEVDSQGRVLIPARIKQLYLDDAKEVVVAGKMNHVLVKAQAKAEEQDFQFMRDRAELLRQLDMIEDD